MNTKKITEGKTCLGIELGSARIKACLIDDTYMQIASGDYEWNNKFENGYWTYSLGEWLDRKVFCDIKKETLCPDKGGVSGFNRYFELYKSGLGAFLQL